MLPTRAASCGAHIDVHHRWLFNTPAQRLLDRVQLSHRCRSFLWHEVSTHPFEACLRSHRGCDDARRVWIPDNFLTARCPSEKSPGEALPSPSPMEIMWMMNASFVEDTDLFVLLLSLPKPARQPVSKEASLSLSHQHVLHDGVWLPVPQLSDADVWLRQGQARVQLQLDDAWQAAELDPPSRTVQPQDEDAYFFSMVVPPSRAGARGTATHHIQADTCWLSADTVAVFRLHCFSDAFHVPCHAGHFAPTTTRAHNAIPCGRFFCNCDQSSLSHL